MILFSFFLLACSPSSRTEAAFLPDPLGRPVRWKLPSHLYTCTSARARARHACRYICHLSHFSISQEDGRRGIRGRTERRRVPFEMIFTRRYGTRENKLLELTVANNSVIYGPCNNKRAFLILIAQNFVIA